MGKYAGPLVPLKKLRFFGLRRPPPGVGDRGNKDAKAIIFCSTKRMPGPRVSGVLWGASMITITVVPDHNIAIISDS